MSQDTRLASDYLWYYTRCLVEIQDCHDLAKDMENSLLDLSKVEDMSVIINSAVSDQLLSVSEICGVIRTLRAVSAVWEKLSEAPALNGDSLDRKMMHSVSKLVYMELRTGQLRHQNFMIKRQGNVEEGQLSSGKA